MTRKISLIQAKENIKVKVIELTGGGRLHQKLMSLGVYEGREITKLSHIGLKGPVVIRAGRSILALGHGIASKIIVGAE